MFYHGNNIKELLKILKSINLTLSFLLELAMILSFGVFGYHTAANFAVKWVLAIGLPLLVISIWASFFAPKAKRRLPVVPGTILSLGLFLGAALVLYYAGQADLTILFAITAIINRILVLIWRQW